MQPDATDLNPPGLSDQQQRAAVLLVSGVKVQDIADHLGVHRTTLWHWRNLETFQAYLNQLRAEAQDQAVEGITALWEKAPATAAAIFDRAVRAGELSLECRMNGKPSRPLAPIATYLESGHSPTLDAS